MHKFSLSINASSMEEMEKAVEELAAHGIKAALDKTQKQAAADKPVKQDPPEEERTAVDGDGPEIATRNRWIELVDGTMVAVKIGEELPPLEQRGRNVKKKEYQEWEQAQLAASDSNEDDSFGDDDNDNDNGEFDDDFGDAGWTTSDVKAIDFATFKQVVKLFAGKNAERGKKLMAKHSKDGSPSIGQYEVDIEGRAAVDAELKEKWSNYDKAIAKVTGA